MCTLSSLPRRPSIDERGGTPFASKKEASGSKIDKVLLSGLWNKLYAGEIMKLCCLYERADLIFLIFRRRGSFGNGL